MPHSFTDATFWICFMVELDRINSYLKVNGYCLQLFVRVFMATFWVVYQTGDIVIDLLDKAG